MIDLGIMNDFADNVELAIFEDLTRCIRKIDRALDAIAKPRCDSVTRPVAARQPSRRVYGGSLSPAPLCRWK